MRKIPYVDTISALLVIACCVLLSCDIGRPDDGLVGVRYSITGTSGASASIGFTGDEDRFPGSGTGLRAFAGWSYEFRIEESSQILALSSSSVRDGKIKAEIFIDGVLKSSHTNTDSLRHRRTSLAWMPQGGVIGYNVQGVFRTQRPQIQFPSGTNTGLEIPATWYGRSNIYGRADTTVVPIAGAPISMSLRQNGSSYGGCLELRLSYYFPDLNLNFDLDRVDQCTEGVFDLKVEAIIPE